MSKDLWICPKCGRQCGKTNQSGLIQSLEELDDKVFSWLYEDFGIE